MEIDVTINFVDDTRDGSWPFVGLTIIVRPDSTESELEAFQWQVSRWQKFLSREVLSEAGYADDQPAEAEVTA
jgi:hypothetical protein